MPLLEVKNLHARVAGPGGRFSLEPAADHWWLAADESAIPAVGTLLEALPETTTVDVHIEVDGPDDEIDFGGRAKAGITWHHRREPAAFGAELAARIQEELFYDLESPVLRATGFDTPYPPARLEKLWLPGVDRLHPPGHGRVVDHPRGGLGRDA